MANTVKRKKLIASINAMTIKDWNHPDEVKIAMDFLKLLEINTAKANKPKDKLTEEEKPHFA